MEPFVDLFQVVYRHMGVDLRGFQKLVAEHLLQVPGRGSVSKHMGGAGMPEGMRVMFFLMPDPHSA